MFGLTIHRDIAATRRISPNQSMSLHATYMYLYTSPIGQATQTSLILGINIVGVNEWIRKSVVLSSLTPVCYWPTSRNRPIGCCFVIIPYAVRVGIWTDPQQALTHVVHTWSQWVGITVIPLWQSPSIIRLSSIHQSIIIIPHLFKVVLDPV